MESKRSKWRLIIVIVGIGLSILFWVFIEGTENRRDNDFLQKEYSGTIEEIVFRAGRAGCPDVLIGRDWVLFTMEEQKVFEEIQINDSIVKRKDSDDIVLYRKDSLGNLLRLRY